ncbi:site-specific integrase [Mycobacterium sp. 94-17]|uniref:tyrosine-type recombinase/integrase n=1 Tax=Mycobacterium sp. 94-17 TaxID=2986147 RepID=UPI002D1E763E|nr:site-specific integrase [Mycobacterium sp. 94-17]MEB4210991.1 site-specific integrase [Mycobacterium sp. 94-17]
MKRNRRAGVEDRWRKTIIEADGTKRTVPSARDGKGLRWMARYVDSRGIERTKSFGRKSDAQAWLDDETTGHMTGTWTDPKLSAVTFGVIAEKWFSTKSHRAPKTVAGYRSILDTVVLPRWENTALRDIQFEDLQVWISSLSVNGSSRFEGKGLSPSRVVQAHQLMGAVFKFAIKAKHLSVNPAAEIELPNKPKIEQRYLSHEQLHLFAVAAGKFRTLVLVLGYCGLRFGEATALQAFDINLKTRRIRVSRSVTYVRETGLVLGETKNHTSRSVPIPKFLVPLLATEIKGRGSRDLVFPSRRDGYMTPGEFRWGFDAAVRTVTGAVEAERQKEIEESGEAETPEFPVITPHDLRHTCASLAISAGANVKVLQTLLGHKTATLTLDRYGHLYPDDLGRIADAFDAAADQLRTGRSLRVVPPVGKTS